MSSDRQRMKWKLIALSYGYSPFLEYDMLFKNDVIYHD